MPHSTASASTPVSDVALRRNTTHSMAISSVSSADFSLNRIIAAASGSSVGRTTGTSCCDDASKVEAIRKGPIGKTQLSETERLDVEKAIQESTLALTGQRQSPDAAARASATASAFLQLAKSVTTPAAGQFVDAFA